MLNVQEKSSTQPSNGNGKNGSSVTNEDSESDSKFSRRRPRSKVGV